MRKQKTKIVLIALIFVVVGILAGVFVNYRKVLNRVTPGFLLEKSGAGALVSVEDVRQTATRDGIVEWTLKAKSAQLAEDKNQTVLKDFAVTFYTREGTPIFVTADQGVLQIDSRDIEASGHVVVKRDDYQLETDCLYYEHNRRTIHARRPVKITAKAFSLTADTVSFELDVKKTQFKGNVQGILHDSILL